MPAISRPFSLAKLLLAVLLGCLPLGAAALADTPPPQQNTPHALIHAYLEQQIRQQGFEGEAEIKLDTTKLSQQATCAQLEAFIAGQGELRSRFSVGLRCLDPKPWVAYVPVQLKLMGQYPVAARALPPNTVLGEHDVALRDGDLMRLPAGAALSHEEVLGHTTVQRIAARQVFKHNTLQAPHSVSRGQTVTLEVRGEGFTASGEGTAMQSGGPGAIIQARTASGQIVQGRVLNAYTVLLTM